MIPHSCRTHMYHNLVPVVPVDLTTDTFHTTLWSVGCLIDFWTEQPGNGDEFQRICLTGERSVNFLIRWLPDQSINRDTETPIDGHKKTVAGMGHVYLKSHASIFTYLLIDQLIDLSINGWTKQTEGHISRKIDTNTHYLTDLSTERRTPLSTEKIEGWRGRAVSIYNQRHQYSPIDRSINQFICQRKEKTDGGTH